jgi:hypothetical protein
LGQSRPSFRSSLPVFPQQRTSRLRTTTSESAKLGPHSISTNAEMMLDGALSFQYPLKYEKDGCRRGSRRSRSR